MDKDQKIALNQALDPEGDPEKLPHKSKPVRSASRPEISYKVNLRGKDAPLPMLSETELQVLDIARAGGAGGAMSRRLGGRSSEIVVRLVERHLGALGKVVPLPQDGPAAGHFRSDGRQAPVLRIAARVLGPSLRRLGDRVYLNGEETDIPAVVAAARARGARIRYPGLDPIDSAFAAGPSVSAPRRRKALDLTGFRP